MKKYYVGAKPFMEWKYYVAGVLSTPATSITCAIYDSAGKLVSATATEACTASATGIYYYDGFTILTTHRGGKYQAIATFTDGTHITRDDNCIAEFEVVKVGVE